LNVTVLSGWTIGDATGSRICAEEMNAHDRIASDVMMVLNLVFMI